MCKKIVQYSIGCILIGLVNMPLEAAFNPSAPMPQGKRLFSSRNLYNVGQNFVIYGDRVVVQRKAEIMTQLEVIQEREKLRKEYDQACKDADDDGKPHPDPNEFIRTHKTPRSGFIYQDPPNGCYFLENDFQFCSSGGQITKVIHQPMATAKTQDYFFHGASDKCKLLAYHVMYNFLYKKRYTLFHQYQLRLPYSVYPELMRVVIFDGNDVLTPEEIYKQESVKLKLKGTTAKAKEQVQKAIGAGLASVKEAQKNMPSGLASTLGNVASAISEEQKKQAQPTQEKVDNKVDETTNKAQNETNENKNAKQTKEANNKSENTAQVTMRTTPTLEMPDLRRDNLLVVYISELGEVGCLPDETLMLASEEEMSVYKLHATNYNMVGKWSHDNNTEKEIFIDSKEGRVITYRRNFVRPEFMKFTIQRGGIGLKPAKEETELTAEDLNPQQANQ